MLLYSWRLRKGSTRWQTKISTSVEEEERDNEWETDGKKWKNRKKAHSVKDNPCTTPTPNLLQLSIVYTSPLHAPLHKKTATRTQQSQFSPPSPFENNIIMYNGEDGEMYEKIDTWDHMLKLDESEMNGLSEYVHCMTQVIYRC